MSKEEYLEMLYQKLNIPRQLLIKYIHSVGTNEENIKDYAMNASCAVVRKDNGFQIDYTAEMINNKDQKIDRLRQQLEDKNELIENLTKRINKYENMFRGRAIKRTGDIQKDIELYIKQLAIEELEKVKILLQNAANYERYTFVGIYDAVNNQIKNLKGEKDVED